MYQQRVLDDARRGAGVGPAPPLASTCRHTVVNVSCPRASGRPLPRLRDGDAVAAGAEACLAHLLATRLTKAATAETVTADGTTSASFYTHLRAHHTLLYL